jgi:hypothetical protein
MSNKTLTREEMISVIEGKSSASRVPMMIHFWTNPVVFGQNEARARELLSSYPYDVTGVGIKMPDVFEAPEDDREYRWVNFDDPYKDKSVGLDEKVAITDWEQLDSILENFPNANYPRMFPSNPLEDGSYRLGHFWFCFFERLWKLGGMTNALTDFYTDPESVHRLFRALTDFYMKVMERGRKECNLDGIFTSDDIGTQTGPFFHQ